MAPENEGRYCNSCAKTVVDFTSMTDEEVQQFFFDHHNQAICGHFKRDQVHRIVIDLPENIFTIKMPAWMRFLVACLLIFGISIFPFETTIAGKLSSEISIYQGEPMIKRQDTVPITKKKTLRIDTTYTTINFTGFVATKIDNKSKTAKSKPDSTKSCNRKDSLNNDSLKTTNQKDLKVSKQKKKAGQKEKESSERILQALLPNKEETNTEIMD
jgi:hypothetical protein